MVRSNQVDPPDFVSYTDLTMILGRLCQWRAGQAGRTSLGTATLYRYSTRLGAGLPVSNLKRCLRVHCYKNRDRKQKISTRTLSARPTSASDQCASGDMLAVSYMILRRIANLKPPLGPRFATERTHWQVPLVTTPTRRLTSLAPQVPNIVRSQGSSPSLVVVLEGSARNRTNGSLLNGSD